MHSHARAAPEFGRNHYVFDGCEGGEQAERLKNKAHVSVANGRALVLAQRAEVRAAETHGSRARPVEAGAESEKRR